MIYNINVGEESYRVALERRGGAWECVLDGRPVQLDVKVIGANTISLIVGSRVYEIKRDQFGKSTRIWIENTPYVTEVWDRRSLSARVGSHPNSSVSRLLASMPGKVLRVLVRLTETVEAGQPLIVVEAMKMQNEMKSPGKGTVKQIVSEGTHVNAGDVLAIVE
ncbi:MAG: biotin/lipoyl-containing protein [Terriglobales bacterium]